MEACETDLHTIMTPEINSLTILEKCSIIIHILFSLLYLRQNNLCHCDLNPRNILLPYGS